jgi:radical SAM protein with 4Fe4S-binding SPASM domain
MSISSNRSLLGKAWLSLIQRGPAGLGRDIRDYIRWQMNRRDQQDVNEASEHLSNWDLNQRELQALPDTLCSKPILVYAEASTRCNLRCFMCRLSFPETTRRVRQHMTLETFAKLEPLLEPESRLSLFGLGEPLMNPHFVEMMRIAKERGVFVGLNSNAMLLDEKIARAMVELEQDLLMISFSGGTKETYERVITGANYERVVSNLRRLNEIKLSAISHQPSAPSTKQQGTRHEAQGTRTQNSGPRTQNLEQDSGLAIERVKPVLELQYTAMRDNFHEIPEAVRLAIDLRCAGMVVMPLTVVDPSLEEQSILKPELQPQVEATFKAARDIAATATYPFGLQLPAISYQQSAFSDQHSALRTQGSGPRTQNPPPPPICHEPWQTFYVRDDGTVTTCCYSNRVLGDLKEQTALEIWNGELYRRFRARMRSDDKPAECRVCHKICGGDWYDQRVDEEQFYDEL